MHSSLGSNVEVVDLSCFLGLDENERKRRPELHTQVNIETYPTARAPRHFIPPWSTHDSRGPCYDTLLAG